MFGGEAMEERNGFLNTLRETRIFRNMSEKTEEILLSLSENEFAAGDMIADGAENASLGVLLSGKAAIYGRQRKESFAQSHRKGFCV